MPIASKGKRGFAAMDPAVHRKLASMGGSAVKKENRSFSRNPKLAAEAGSKGGKAIAPEKRTFSTDHELASKSGRKGGLARKKKRVIAEPIRND